MRAGNEGADGQNRDDLCHHFAATFLDGNGAAGQRELSTDRPDKTESPYTVPAGRFQIEADLAAFTIDRVRENGLSVRTETFSIGAANFKYGLGPNTDIQVILEPFVREVVRAAGATRTRRTRSLSDLTLRLKHNLWGNDGGQTALALMPYVTIPTNGGRPVEFGLIVPLAVRLSDGASLGLMTELDFVADEDGRGREAVLVNSATIGLDLIGSLGGYTEIFAERALAGEHPWVVTWDTGLTLGIGDNLQLDGGVNVGLTEAADDITFFLSVSRRF